MGLIKDRHTRKLEKYSDGFNEIFNFFLISGRKGLLTFGGSGTDVKFVSGGYSVKEAFRRYDDGEFKDEKGVPSPILTRHVNLAHVVVMAKKSWGLHVKMWAEGIADCDFTIDEIKESFREVGLEIPTSLLKGFENEVQKRKIVNIENYFRT